VNVVASSGAQSRALAGVRVLDLTNAIAGSSSTMLLARFGAEVIKVEAPGRGDFTRSKMPYAFEAFNAGKRSVTIDLTTPEGAALVRQIAAGCDVFVQSQRPGSTAMRDLSPEVLREANPQLIYASVSAFGARGPKSGWRGVDAVVQAESGLASMQGAVHGPTSLIDIATGLALSQSVVMALMQRLREPDGPPIDIEVSLLATALYLQGPVLAEFLATNTLLDQHELNRRYPTGGVFDAQDGPFMMPWWDPDWSRLCAVLDSPELAVDPRFLTPAARRENRYDVQAELARIFRGRPREHWMQELRAIGVMVGEVRTYDEVVQWEQVVANDLLYTVAASGEGEVTSVREPFQLSFISEAERRAAPALGHDTESVLTELGLSASDIESMRAAGAIGGYGGDHGR
jgi:crotonobetainyl-CoA:carnitine CoA-transferase CaiB-like acyl-CoA transferase